MSMFKSLGADLTGANDNCYIISKSKFATEEFVQKFTPLGETPSIYLKSGIKEFLFTDKSLIISSKNAATSTKRNVRRFDYNFNDISGVDITTPGMGTDGDFEISFNIGPVAFQGDDRVNVWKSELDKGILVFNCLNVISSEQKRRAKLFSLNQNSEHATAESTEKVMQSFSSSYASIIGPYADKIN